MKPQFQQRVRVGAVNYLNAKPLIENLPETDRQIEFSLDLPSRLADQLKLGTIDVGLIPVIEYFRGEGYRILPDMAIGSRGAVLSVTLFSRCPWGSIESVALDEGSRTSAALTAVLSHFRYQRQPRWQSLAIDANPEQVDTDAVLLIGDRAMHACLPGFPYAYDLGQEWFDWTNLPFVFAVWAVRWGCELPNGITPFIRAKEWGCYRAGVIAQREAKILGLDAGFCRRYLSNVIRYDLGEREELGLRTFYEYASQLGLAPAGVSVEYYQSNYHSKNLVESC